MKKPSNLQPELRRRVLERIAGLPAAEREALLIKCWMSHDARWFMAVAQAHGMEAANRINQAAVHETAKVEAHRLARAFGLPKEMTLADVLLAVELFIGTFGPDLLDYELFQDGPETARVCMRRCFAADNAKRAGIADSYDCGIFARVTGWLEGLGVAYEMTPGLGKCFMCQGQECVYTLRLQTA
jgi:hypothetical protein